MKICATALFLAFATCAHAGEFSSAFAVVMIDDATESAIGPFPYDRSVMAKAVDQCAKAKAKAVALKFFFDQPKSAAGDLALVGSMKKIPVLIQARLEDIEGTTQPIPKRFRFAETRVPVAVSGDKGWIPLPSFMDAAADLGFVDFASITIPLVEEYQGAAYKSFIVCCLELAAGGPAHIGPGSRVRIGSGSLPVNESNAYTATLKDLEPIKPISFARLLSGEVNPDELAGRVVIIGWDSSQTPTLPTPNGPVPIHRFFVQCLSDCYRTLQLNSKTGTTPQPLFEAPKLPASN